MANHSITQAILPIAGLGTRFLPWTKSVPKEMLPIGTRPIIALIVDECLEAAISDICFVISKGKEIIPQYFAKDETLNAELAKRGKLHLIDELRKYDEVRFNVVYQDEQRGDGHAILQAAEWVESDEIAVLFGDDYFVGVKSGLRQLIEAYDRTEDAGERAILAVERIPWERISQYGIVDVVEEGKGADRLRRVRGLVEKPSPEDAPSTFGIVGRYLIPHSTLSVLRTAHSNTKDGEVRLIDAIQTQLSSLNIFGYECEGKRIDTGTSEGYREAIINEAGTILSS